MSTAPLEQRKSRARLAFVLLALYLPLQMLAMHWPLPKMPLGPWRIWDKAPHFMVYAVFASLLVWYVVAQRRAHGKSNADGLARRFLMAFVCVASYAWLDELTQPFTGRSCDVYDWFADILGAGVVFVAAYVWRRCRSDNAAPTRSVSNRGDAETRRRDVVNKDFGILMTKECQMLE